MAIAQWDMHPSQRDRPEDGAGGGGDARLPLDPQLADAHAALGAVHQGQGAIAGRARGLRGRPADSIPDSYDGNRVAGMCCMALRRFDDAVRYFEKAASRVETDFVAASFAVQCYEANGDVVRAREAAHRALARIEKVIAAEPDHGGHSDTGPGSGHAGREASARKEWIARGTLLDPRNTILHFNFVCAMVQLRDLETAFELLQSFMTQVHAGLCAGSSPTRTSIRFATIRDFGAMLAEAKARLGIG